MYALISTYAGEEQMSITISEEVTIHQGVPTCVLLDNLGLRGLIRE